MSEPARGPHQPMASGRRPASSRPPSVLGGTATELATVQPRIPWTRRIGIVIALVALGGTVVLAGGFGHGADKPPASSSSHPTATGASTPRASAVALGAIPKTAPALAEPSSTVTAKKTWTAQVTLTATGIARANLKLRIYRDDQAIMDVAVRRSATMSVRNIPLKRGSNAFTAVFVSPGGEGPRSNVVTLTLDDVVPRISLTQPQNHAVIDAASVTLTGQTEAAATLIARNLTHQDTATTTAGADGRFSLAVTLLAGANDLQITATDAAGNVGQTQLTVTRGSGGASAHLTLSATTFHLAQLPATFDVTYTVTDANGLGVDGATVTFSLSPPGVPTSTFQATTQSGRASWPGVTLSGGIQAGDGLVTARVTLPGGPTLQRTATFVVR